MDTGDRSAALASIRAALAGVEDPLALLEGLFAVAPFGLQIYDAKGQSLAVNQAFLDLFGSAPPPEYNVLADDIAERQGFLPLIREAFAGKTVRMPVTWYDPRELRSVRVEEGNRVAIDTTMFPISDREGRVTHVAFLFKDVTREETARKETERERDLLRQGEIEAARTARFREQFIGMLGHDLRSPLTAIVASAGLVLRHENLPQGVSTAATRIASAGDRMRRMIGDLLDFTQARLGGGIAVERREIDLAPLLGQMVDEVTVGHPGRNVLLKIVGDLRGSFDADRIAQMIGNLLENALTHGPPDTPVVVEAQGTAAAVRIGVCNEGPPLAADEQQRVFLPFERGSHASRRGLGLGLFIVDQIARAHGGTMELRSDPSETRFTAVLPRQR
ncbi:MAG: PAS domain-containing sensor histidine kinase [Deltaproteobacteria bacterium]|nr:MAG: PAS domain-containing sensor histidine kinase [Deltaproteobacteria bacterium]